MKIMVLKSNISITQFLFTLEEFLLENLVISNRRELEWHIVEYYKNLVIRDLQGSFQLDKKQFLSFTKNYNQRRRIFEKYKHTVDLDPLKVLLRQARDVATTTTESASTPQTGCPGASHLSAPQPAPFGVSQPLQAPFDTDKVCELLSKLIDEVADLKVEHCDLKKGIADLKVELCDLKVVFSDLKQVVLANVAEQRPEKGFQTPGGESSHHLASTTEYEATRVEGLHVLQIINGVTSKRPFVRARQRVALCILYISGLTIPNLLRLTVCHLKQLRQFAHGGSATFTDPFRLRVPPSEAIKLVANLIAELDILVSDVSDETTAFRAHSHSVRPCPRESLAKELNQILGHFKLSTKSWRTMAEPRCFAPVCSTASSLQAA